jgi:ribosomal protein L11 methylase PrmA
MLLIIQLITFLIIIGLLYLLTWFLPTDSPWAPWWTTSKEKSRLLCKMLKLGKKDIFYELGSGTGTTLSVAAKEFGAKTVGIESDALRVWWAKQKIKRLRVTDKVSILKQDFFSIDLSPATVVYLYLVPRVITKLKPKLMKELKPGTRVVSYIYPIDYLPLVSENSNEQLYVYSIPVKKNRKIL